MDTYDEILRALGRIEGQLIEIARLSERVSKIEVCLAAKRKRDSAQPQGWMMGGWAALAGTYAYLFKTALGK